VNERPLRKEPVLVAVAEHELARLDRVERGTISQPLHRRLGDAVAEAEVLALTPLGVEPLHKREPIGRQPARQLLVEALQ